MVAGKSPASSGSFQWLWSWATWPLGNILGVGGEHWGLTTRHGGKQPHVGRARIDPTCQAYFSSLNVPRAVVQWPLLMLLFIYLFLAFFSLSLLQSLAGKHLLIPQVSAQNVAS